MTDLFLLCLWNPAMFRVIGCTERILSCIHEAQETSSRPVLRVKVNVNTASVLLRTVGQMDGRDC